MAGWYREMLSKDLEFIRKGINSASGNGDRWVRTNGSLCTGMGTYQNVPPRMD